MSLDRIVVINDSTVALGGATGLALASAEAFAERGYATTFLAGDAGENAGLTAAGVQTIGLGQARLLASPGSSTLLRALYNPAAERMVADWITRFDTPGTVYHLHGWAQIFSPSILRPLSKVADRLVLSAHDFFLVCPNGSYSFLKSGEICELTPQSMACVTSNCDRRNYAHKLWRVGRQAVRRAVFNLSHRRPLILAIHARMAPFLERGGVPLDTIQTLPNPVRPFSAERVKAETNQELVFIGRLEHGKGPDLACAAAAKAGMPMRIIGDGPMASALKRDYPGVAFSGRLAPSEIGAVIAKARGLVMPSRYPEPYGLVATEALWSGVPVIASDTAFLTPDIVARGAGLACTPRDTVGFAAALGRFATDDHAVQAMSVAAFDGTRDLGSRFEDWIDALILAYRQRLGVNARPALGSR